MLPLAEVFAAAVKGGELGAGGTPAACCGSAIDLMMGLSDCLCGTTTAGVPQRLARGVVVVKEEEEGEGGGRVRWGCASPRPPPLTPTPAAAVAAAAAATGTGTAEVSPAPRGDWFTSGDGCAIVGAFIV